MARRRSHNDGGHEQHHHHHHGGIDYNVGRYAPKKNLGKIIVSVNNDEKVWHGRHLSNAFFTAELFSTNRMYSMWNCFFLFFHINLQEYEDGEVLVEHEPIRYELRDIKKDRIRTSHHPDPRVLGSAVLANTVDHSNAVETVITFTYDKIIYWGTIEGVARGLPTEVFENPKLPPVDLGKTGWGFRINETKTEVRRRPDPFKAMKMQILFRFCLL